VKLRLRYWIDGKRLNDMSKSLPAGKAWIPAVHFLEKDLEVILNPFCVGEDAASSSLISKALKEGSSKEAQDDFKSGGQHSFPACLSQSTATYQSAFLASELSKYLVAYDFRTQDSAGKILSEHELLKQVEKLSTKEDVDAIAVADEEEEPKEEAKGEAESSSERARADALSGLPKFEMRIMPSTASAKSPEEGTSDEKAAATNEKLVEKAATIAKPRYVLLRFQSE